jgi:hypothetical protein
MEAEDAEEENGDINATVTQLFRQLLIDIMIKVPNPRRIDTTPYCKLDRNARLTVTEELYKNRRLPDLWHACYFKVVREEEFERAFHHLFPPPTHQTGNVQNYRQCEYYIRWKEMCDNIPHETINAIRREVMKRVMRFGWLPHACQDKMWATKRIPGFKRYPSESEGPAPRILLRGKPKF